MSSRLPTLASLATAPRITPTTLRDLPGSRQTKTLLGRGPGSGKGKTSGRGHKGQGKYGTGKGPGFEGGQTPLHRLLPKVGFTNNFSDKMQSVNLGRLQLWVDQGRIDPAQLITQKVLFDVGLATDVKAGVKLLAGGAERFGSPVRLEVSRASTEAIMAVEEAGGSVTCVYRSALNLRAHLKPQGFTVIPREARPVKAKTISYYSDWANRGYLATPPEA